MRRKNISCVKHNAIDSGLSPHESDLRCVAFNDDALSPFQSRTKLTLIRNIVETVHGVKTLEVLFHWRKPCPST